VANQFGDGRFRFAVGIEDTFVPQTAVGRRALDEYELTQHYDRWASDLELARATGATTMRYGIPWYLVNPERGRFAWSWLDRVVDKLGELGIEAIVDLMHYGTPLWLDNQFLNSAYPDAVAEYAAAIADRYRGRLTAFTPLNEPLINAIFCGEEARWPPYLAGGDGFVKLVRALVRGIVATQAAIDDVTAGESTFVHVEATQRFAVPDGPPSEEVEFLRGRVFLVEDLLTGRVDDDHELAGFLRANGFRDDDLAWCSENTAHPDVMGVNYYPHLTTVEVTAGGRATWQRVDGGTHGLEEMMRSFAERYGAPVFLTETSQSGPVADRLAWLDASIESLFRLRDDGLDVVGYTWWPLFDLVDWNYREGIEPPEHYLVQMGMYDLRRDDVGRFERAHTPVVDRFRLHTEAAVPV
jgi:beta-glucosidase